MDVTTAARPPRHAHAADLPALAERDMLTVYAARVDVPPLAPKTVRLDSGQFVQIDGVSPDEDLFVIPISHQGMLPEDAGAHLARDVFSLSLVTASRPGARAVLLFASEPARDSARSLIGGLDRENGILLDAVDLGLEWNERLIEASRPAGRHREGGTPTDRSVTSVASAASVASVVSADGAPELPQTRRGRRRAL